MTTRREGREKRRLRSRRIRAILAGGLVFGVGAAATIAAWTDQELATTTITAGTFSIVSRAGTSGSFSASGPGTNTVTFTADLSGMRPGVRKAQVVQVQPGGSLGGTLNLTGVTVTNNAGGAPTGADLELRNALRVAVTVIPPEQCTDASVAMPSGGLASVPTVAQQTLTTSPLSTISYCFVIGLPADATGQAQGGVVRPTWTFTGQTD